MDISTDALYFVICYLGTEINEPLGLCAYKDYMYFIDAKNFYDGYDISRIALDGSETQSTQMRSVFDEWGLNNAIDIVMYDFGKYKKPKIKVVT